MHIVDILLESRAVEAIDNIIFKFVLLVHANVGFMRMLVSTIMNNPYLLVSVSLLLCGFVIGIIKRLISS